MGLFDDDYKWNGGDPSDMNSYEPSGSSDENEGCGCLMSVVIVFVLVCLYVYLEHKYY